MAKVHIILESVLFNPCFLCLLPTYGGKVYGGKVILPKINFGECGLRLFYSGTSSELHSLARGFSEDGFGNYNPQYMPIVLITDFTCEIHDEDGELNTVKFTYQYQDRRTYLPTDYLSVDHEKIFTAEYNPAFE